MNQPPYTLAQVRASLKLIAGLCACDTATQDPEQALAEIQGVCANILHRGIVSALDQSATSRKGGLATGQRKSRGDSSHYKALAAKAVAARLAKKKGGAK